MYEDQHHVMCAHTYGSSSFQRAHIRIPQPSGGNMRKRGRGWGGGWGDRGYLALVVPAGKSVDCSYIGAREPYGGGTSQQREEGMCQQENNVPADLLCRTIRLPQEIPHLEHHPPHPRVRKRSPAINRDCVFFAGHTDFSNKTKQKKKTTGLQIWTFC